VVLFDIDHFKRINDTYGHQAGDVVLIGVSQCVAAAAQGRCAGALWRRGIHHPVARTDLAQAGAVADKLRVALEECVFDVEGDRRIKVTASFGVAALAGGEALDS
jgi:diguanylate cyclase (GGDEF)-like protein